MSSTSSDYGNCPRLHYDRDSRVADNVQVYPNFGGHPLVYYAHIPQDCRLQRNKTKKKNSPNCFVKAFRWYTQELPSPQAGTPCNNVNIGGFAAWLDKKYEEFLNDSKCEQNCPQFKSKQCFLSASNKIVNRLEKDPEKTKKYPRLKSPWKKKRRLMYEAEKGDLYEKHSFQFLLRPQDISRVASECCQRTSSCNASNATYITTKSPILTKMKVKSHSTMCLTKVQDALERQINIINYDEDIGNINRQTSTEKTVLEHAKVTTKRFDYKPPKKYKGAVTCECKRDNLNFKSVTTQYSKVSPINQTKTVYCQSSQHRIGKSDRSCQYFLTPLQGFLIKETCTQENCYPPPCCQCRKTEDLRLNKPQQFYQQNSKTNTITSLKHDSRIATKSLVHSVQTSDHSIIFQQDPLVVKILCEKK